MRKPPGSISSVILWSVISAAFIGPGTVTTAVSAGSLFQLDLLWTVLFATVACIVLQEVSARVCIASGFTLGEALTIKFGARQGKWWQWLIGGSVVLGCAAYEAGNILGAVAGLNLLTGIETTVLTIMVSIVVFGILWIGKFNTISNLMMLLVAIMGVTFFVLARSSPFSSIDIFSSSVVPSIPTSSELLVLGLVGTTIVPYNLFLGSGISKGQTVSLMRVGLTVSVLIGGFITASILVAGTTITDFSSFPSLANAFEVQLGKPGFYALALGLFAAGFSSAITSPFAASIIARTVFGMHNNKNVRWMWSAVLLTGFIFGVSGIKPIPVILVVQALNGFILPALVIFLILIINDKKLIPAEHRHQAWYNGVLLLILFVVVLISINQLDKVIGSLFHSQPHFIVALILSACIVLWVAYWLMIALQWKHYRK